MYGSSYLIIVRDVRCEAAKEDLLVIRIVSPRGD
jgi:hypothetical protein